MTLPRIAGSTLCAAATSLAFIEAFGWRDLIVVTTNDTERFEKIRKMIESPYGKSTFAHEYSFKFAAGWAAGAFVATALPGLRSRPGLSVVASGAIGLVAQIALASSYPTLKRGFTQVVQVTSSDFDETLDYKQVTAQPINLDEAECHARDIFHSQMVANRLVFLNPTVETSFMK